MAAKAEEKITIYVVHDYHDEKPLALFLRYDDAWDYVGASVPRGMIHEVQIDAKRWIALDEFPARTLE